MATGKYYAPESKEQAVKMAVGLDCTYDLLHALQGRCFRLDAHPDRSRSAWPRRGQTPGMTAAGPRPSHTGRVAAPGCLTHMCHHVHAAGQRDLHLALLQANDHSTVPGPVMAPGIASSRRSCQARLQRARSKRAFPCITTRRRECVCSP
jgi:hypothetical protein